jgi:DNA-binding CsgD family transcriptional regulator
MKMEQESARKMGIGRGTVLNYRNKQKLANYRKFYRS